MMKQLKRKSFKSTAAILSLSALSLAGTASGVLVDVNFGSDHDGLGGFTTSTQSSQTVFETLDDSIQTRRGSGSNDRSAGIWTDAFTGANALRRSAGSTHIFTTVVSIASHSQYSDANVSLMLFSDAAETSPSGITLKMHFGTSTPRMQIDSGVRTFDSTSAQRQDWTGLPMVGGGLFTLQGIVSFTEDDAIVTFNLTDSADPANTASVTRTFDKDDLTWGDFHGVGTQHTRIDFNVYSFTAVGSPFSLTITQNASTPGSYDFEWSSQPDKFYDLLTSTDLAGPIAEWLVYDDGVRVHGDIPSAGAVTTLSAVPSSDPRRFFAIREFDAPPPPPPEPFFLRDFENDNGGFTVVTTAGSDWQYGRPDAEIENTITIDGGNEGSEEGAWGVELTGPYAAGTVTALRSPPIDLSVLPEGVGVQLTYALALDMPGDASLVVRIIEEDGDGVIGDAMQSITAPSSANWANVGPIDLPEEAIGQIVRIEWLFTSPSGDSTFLGAYIDDVALTETTAESEKNAPSGMILTWTDDPTTSIVIDWHRLAEDADTPAYIQTRPRGTAEWFPIEAERFPFPHSDRLVDRISIENLQPDTEYEFRGSPGEKTYWFRTMPATLDRPIVMAAGGDVRHQKEWMSAMNLAAMVHDPDLIVWGGDLAYCDGSSSNTHLWYEFLDSMVETLVTPEGRVPPVVVGMGNHEIQRAYHRGRINSHADRERLAPFFYGLFAFPGDPGYGVLDFGNYLSIVMGDSDHSNPVEGEQTDWMQQTLSERNHVPHLIPVYHVPAYPSVRSFSDRVGQLVREHWVPLFEENGIRLVLENHDHSYKRTVPIFEGAEDAERGVVYMGDGCWGVGTRGVHNVENTWYLEQAQGIRHALIITLHPDHKVVEAIDAQNNLIDTTTIPARENL